MARHHWSGTVALLGAAMLAVSGCGSIPPADAAPVAKAAPTTLEGLCAALQPDASYTELRAVLGDGVSIDEEGNLFINQGSERALEPLYRERFTGAFAGFSLGEYEAPSSSAWTLHGLRIGATLADVERANGRPFVLSEDGIDWNGGVLGRDGCDYELSWEDESEAYLTGRSDDPAVRARAPKIADIAVRWRRDGYTVPRPALAPPVPVATRRSFGEVCDRLRETMGPDDLARAFGSRNTRDLGDNLWAVFPDDPTRVFRVQFRDTWDPKEGDLPWRVYAVTIDSPVSTWALPNGLGMGDRLDAVERAAGGAFAVSRHGNATASGPEWSHGGAESLGACSYHLTLSHDRALIEEQQFRSDDAAFRSWRPRVTAVRIDWRGF